jgi:acyl dehydratase
VSAVILHIAELAGRVGVESISDSWFTIDQRRIDTFAEVTGDHQWIHVDATRANDGPFGSTVAHGYLTLSLLPALTAGLIDVRGGTMTVNYGLNRVRFVSPVPSGSRVRARSTIVNVDEDDAGVRVTTHVTIDREGSDRPALVAETVTLYRR